VVVTLILSYATLVFGELAPKRIAMQRAEGWGLVVARPLAGLSRVTRPVVWLLSASADLVVRLFGADPHQQRADVTEEEIRDLVAAQASFTPHQRSIISGAFEIAERTLHEVMRPRRDVVVIDVAASCKEAVEVLLASGHSRAPVAEAADLDRVVGVVHLRDVIDRDGPVTDAAQPPFAFPETAPVLYTLRELQHARQQLAIVINEHGGAEGIVTVEDLLEEIVGEIYDETDKDFETVEREPDGAVVLPGRFPVHDLEEIGIEVPEGHYATVAGLVLAALGRIPEAPGDTVTVGAWQAEVLEVEGRAITKVRLRRAR
jgi:putative hemolysin